MQKRRNANSIVGITSTDFDANHFDFSICNHAMKHVQDDKKAMGECHRVLKPWGKVIFNLPLSGEPETREPNTGMSVPEIKAIVG
ncbi:methyltransferase domain-containing protein [Candidatus Ponderosibacter sp. Uisw_141_02]|uniref:methyltransferase domain-containing protein n=1 Tax=Candidatus Ponderosibacter sp. Uisw_141_02 TaxID=3231000 RepID=UPI003D4C6C9F